MVRRIAIMGTALLVMAALWGSGARPASAHPADQASDPLLVIQLVNNLRAEYGLPAYTVNQALMAAAQQQSDYQASIGQISHYGPNGSRPKDRAAAVGYAPAGSFFIHENIWGGTQGSAYDAVAWWRNSALHFEGMTSTRYTETGAGVAVDENGLAYYTIVFAMRSGSAPPATSASSGGSGSTSGSSGQSSGAARATALPALPYEPVEVASREADGSIWHEVKDGQNFSDIAEEYDVDIYDILAINNMGPEDIIHPGDRLMIEPPYTPTPEPPTPTPTQTPTPEPGIVPTAEDGIAPVGDQATMAALAAQTAQAREALTATAEATALSGAEIAAAGTPDPALAESDPGDFVKNPRGSDTRPWLWAVVIGGVVVLGVLGMGMVRKGGQEAD